MKYLIVLMAFLLLISGAFATSWYNDTPDNDTCLTIYSDAHSYASVLGVVSGELKIDNQCGTVITNQKLGFFDSSPLYSQLTIDNSVVLDKKMVTPKLKTAYKDVFMYESVLVDPAEIYLKDDVWNYDKYVLTQDQYDRATYVDDKNGQTTPVYVGEYVLTKQEKNLYSTQEYDLTDIPMGESIIPFKFKTSTKFGEFGFNIEGLSFLDPPYAPYDANFISDWNFDSAGAVLYDVNTAFPRDATIAGTYTAGQAAGATNLVYSYNFATTYASMANNEVFRRQQFSVSLWFKTTNTGYNGLFANMANRTVAQAAGWMVIIGDGSAGKITFYMGSVDGGTAETTLSLPGAYNDGAWHHLVATYDGTNKRLYLDGNLDGSPQAASLAYNATTYPLIGTAWINGSSVWPFTGNLDEIAYWDRALSSAEVDDLWNAGDGFPYPFYVAPTSGTKTFNVYRAGAAVDLTHVDMDCNDDAYDLNNQTSPFNNVMNIGVYSCDFLVQNGYDTNNQEIVVTGDDTTTIYLTDNTAPTSTITATAGDFTVWNATNGQFTLACDDKNGSGCNGSRYRLDSGAWVTYTGAVNITTDGNHRIDYNAVDVAGNSSTVWAIWYALDKSGPTVGTTTITGFDLYTTYIKGTGSIIGGTATDTLSGIDNTTGQYTSNNGAAWAAGTWNVNHVEFTPFTINNGTTYQFNTRISDNVANVGTGTATIAYVGDTVGPTTTDDGVAYYNTDEVDVTITADDGTGSGVKATWYCVDNTGTCDPTTLGNVATITVPSGFIYNYFVRYVASDNLDTNGAINTSVQMTIDNYTVTPYPDNNSNKYNWLTLTDGFADSLFGFDYTMFGIFALLIVAVLAFMFRTGALAAIIFSIPVTFGFLMLSGGTSYILAAILILEIIALVVKVAMSFLNIGNASA